MSRAARRVIDLDKIAKLARARRLQDPFHSVDTLRNHLETWWSFKFNRPLKDPLLKEYALEELIYEFFVHFYADPENDPLKEAQKAKAEQSDMEWAQKMLTKGIPGLGTGAPPPEPKPEPPKAPAPSGPEAPPEAPQTQAPPDLPDLSTSFER
jgi:hypothetical protein